LHTAQLMPLPLTVSCFTKIQIDFTFWYRLTWVVPDKGPLNGWTCVLSACQQLLTGTTQWREDWSSASVVNHTIVSDPTIRQPGFHLPHHTWSLVNRFRTCQGPCRANLHRWGLAQSPSCDCGQRQTMNHIVDTCPLTYFEGGLLLHEDDDAVIQLESTATASLAK